MLLFDHNLKGLQLKTWIRSWQNFELSQAIEDVTDEQWVSYSFGVCRVVLGTEKLGIMADKSADDEDDDDDVQWFNVHLKAD